VDDFFLPCVREPGDALLGRAEGKLIFTLNYVLCGYPESRATYYGLVSINRRHVQTSYAYQTALVSSSLSNGAAAKKHPGGY